MDSESIGEDIFDDYIEYDDNEDVEERDANKENHANNADVVDMSKHRVSKEQYAKMDQFHKEHSEALVEGAISDQLWDDLASSLNAMGPSVQSVQDWKRKWALRKYYHKQRLKKSSTKTISAEKPSHSNHSVEANESLSGNSSGFEKKVLRKLDQILDRLNEVMEIQSSKVK